jgi:hypothetical protein
VTEDSATALAAAIAAETGLRTTVVDTGDGVEYVVDIEVASTSSGVVREVLTAWDEDDWPWLRERLPSSN